MTSPFHETLRAVGQGILGGTAVVVPLAFAVAYLGPAELMAASLATGAGLITVANALKRREQRNNHARVHSVF